MEKENEVNKLFDNLKKDEKDERVDIFESPKETEEVKPEIKEVSEEDEPRKNRRHRRWEAQLSKKEKELIAREARIDALSEVSKEKTSDDVDSRWLQMYGDTPESRKAWDLQQDIFDDYKSKIKEETLQEIRNESIEAQKQEKQFEVFIDNELESIEDEFNIDITSNSPQAKKTRREFLSMVQNLSPKDEDGTITGYADFEQTWKLYQSQKKDIPDVSRNKDIASLSMEKSDSVVNTEKQQTPGFRGWMKDYNL